jgi:hypothetical protein
MASEHGGGDRELHRRRAREARSRVPRGPTSAGEALHVNAGRPREATREWGDFAGERGVLVRGDCAGARARGQTEDVLDVR